MAAEVHYGAQSIREVASHLWQLLSKIFGEPISKANFRHTLELQPFTKAQQQQIKKQPSNTIPTLEFPSGPVMLSSRLYIPRSPIEEFAYR